MFCCIVQIDYAKQKLQNLVSTLVINSKLLVLNATTMMQYSMDKNSKFQHLLQLGLNGLFSIMAVTFQYYRRMAN